MWGHGMDVTAILLAGGRSSRFGRDKSLLCWQDRPIVERLAEQCAAVADEVLIVSNSPGKFRLPGVRELSDRYPDMGPLGGLHAGLAEAAHPWVFVTACDMPLFHAALARDLLTFTAYCEAVLPRCGTRLQPLFSVLRREPALREAEWMLSHGRRRLRELYERLDTFYLDLPDGGPGAGDPAADLFYNINYPADYERLVAGVRKEGNG